MTKPTGKLSVVAFATILLAGQLTTAFGHEVNFSCPATFGNAPDPSGLIAYYPFNFKASDASGNGLDAIKVNATRVPGKMGNGYFFNGRNSYIRLPIDITPTVYPQITLTAWIKPTSTKGTRYIFNQGDQGSRGLFISNGNVNGAAGKSLMGQGRHAIYPNRWIFVALTYDQKAGTATLLSDIYISAINATLPETSRPTILLGAKSPGKSGFEGIIDEVRVYNRVLSTAQLAKVKNQSSQTVVSTNACANVTCSTGQACYNGYCFNKAKQSSTNQVKSGKTNACANVTCPTGQTCYNGGCFNKKKQSSAKSIQPLKDKKNRASAASKVLTKEAARTINKYSFGAKQQEFSNVQCMYSMGLVITRMGQQGGTGMTLVSKGSLAEVVFQNYPARGPDRARYQDEWKSKSNGIRYSANGNKVTASGTLEHTKRSRYNTTLNKWEDVTRSVPLLSNQPFTFSAYIDTCIDAGNSLQPSISGAIPGK